MKTTKNNITDWLEANPNPEIEALVNKQVKKMEYWKKLSDKYIGDTANKTEDELRVWFKLYDIRNKRLTKLYGESSWRIHEFFELCRAEEISESKFRELVRFEMEENFKKRKRDLKNKYKSQLAELEHPKMDKRDKTEEIERLKIILKVIDEL